MTFIVEACELIALLTIERGERSWFANSVSFRHPFLSYCNVVSKLHTFLTFNFTHFTHSTIKSKKTSCMQIPTKRQPLGKAVFLALIFLVALSGYAIVRRISKIELGSSDVKSTQFAAIEEFEGSQSVMRPRYSLRRQGGFRK